MIVDRHVLKNPMFDSEAVDAVIEPKPRPTGRPPKPEPSAGRAAVIRGITNAQRHRFVAMGFTDSQIETGLRYCERGYTFDAAARLVLADGRPSALTQPRESRA